ncbi:glycosyltransferase [Saccharopolyspora sp. WRP15-2]|uniref:Glycosyltransferase n=1 Tax=Saccharopolyspora oryzae TaxID=2997343 RepID=A0ABT4UVL0_9PSEU|nr:macrolide family glycosyltransferase [Saccharopolyspora oryzae]MDA3625765.1 glycosyltransferase [Saccharopolyspora oryzae]
MTNSAQNAYRTRPAHIAFFTIPAHGHINPTLGLITELVNRGHRVSYAVTEPFADQVAEAGATPVRYDSMLPGSPNASRQEWPSEGTEARWMFLEETRSVVPQLEEAFAGDRPDLVVYDLGDFLVLAEKWGVPALQLCPTHVYTEGLESVLDLTPTPETTAVEEAYDEYFAEQGVALTNHDLLHPRRCIVTIPRSFQYFGDQAADSYAFVGPMLTERASQGSWQAPDDRPVLVISLGSAYNDRLDFYRRCLVAFADLDWHVVLAVGTAIDPAELGAVPANFEVHRWIPQLRMLSQASAFITHAGMGGTMEGLSHGVPLIAVPQAADQFMNAARIEELGLGVQLDGATATPEQLRVALEKVTSDEGIRNRLADMRREIEEAGGLARAVEIVEGML